MQYRARTARKCCAYYFASPGQTVQHVACNIQLDHVATRWAVVAKRTLTCRVTMLHGVAPTRSIRLARAKNPSLNEHLRRREITMFSKHPRTGNRVVKKRDWLPSALVSFIFHGTSLNGSFWKSWSLVTSELWNYNLALWAFVLKPNF